MLDTLPNTDDTPQLISGPKPETDVLTVELLRQKQQIIALAPAWRELSGSLKGSCFFQSPAWCLHVSKEMSSTHSDELFEPIVAAVWRGPKLVAVWPLSLRNANGLRILTSLAAPFDQYTDMLSENPAVGAQATRLVAKALRQEVSADGMILRKVKTASALRVLTRDFASIIDEGDRAPQIRFEEGQTFTDYTSGINAKTRKNIRNYKNRLKREGQLDHQVLEGAAIAAALRKSFSVRRKWLEDTGQSSAGFRNASFERVVCKLAENDTPDLGLIAFALTLNGVMIAIQWGFIHQGCYYAYLSSRDPEFEAYSIGRIHLQMVLEHCHKIGVTRVDLMVPDVPYKKTWATSTDEVVDVIWPWSVRGYLYLRIYNQTLRPHFKQLVQWLPTSLRRLVLSRLNASLKASA